MLATGRSLVAASATGPPEFHRERRWRWLVIGRAERLKLGGDYGHRRWLWHSRRLACAARGRCFCGTGVEMRRSRLSYDAVGAVI